MKLENDLYIKRNDLMHSHWFISAANLKLTTRIDKITRRGKTGFALKLGAPSVESLEELIKEIRKAAREVREIVGSNGKAIKRHIRITPKFPTVLMLHGNS